jgi:OmpA-OmpF porin, OOP family
MVKSPVTQPSGKVEKRAREPEPNAGNFLLVSIFRLLLLGVSSSLAVLVGMAIAQFYPDNAQEPPIVEKALRQSQNWVNQQKQRFFPTPKASIAPSPIAPVVSPSIAPSPIDQLPQPSPSPLSKADRDKLQAELAQLQVQLKRLGDRASTLETQLGSSETAASLEQRLQSIQRQLEPATTSPTSKPFNSQPITAAPPVTPTVAPTITATQGKALMVTLPSDALFDSTQTSLRPESLAILDSLIRDLQRYPGATVRVSAHVDEQGAVEADRSRSFEQAKAVKQYLTSKLGKDYQWVAIGYGQSRPLAGNTSPGDPLRVSQGDRQRNRRIEITIDPQ